MREHQHPYPHSLLVTATAAEDRVLNAMAPSFQSQKQLKSPGGAPQDVSWAGSAWSAPHAKTSQPGSLSSPQQ